MEVKARMDGERMTVYLPAHRVVVQISPDGLPVLQAVSDLFEPPESELAQFASPELLMADMIGFLAQVAQVVSMGGNADATTFCAPTKAQLHIFGGCNLRCVHCSQFLNSILMPEQKAIFIVDTLAENGLFEVTVTGGEPTLHPQFRQIMARCAELGLATSIITNGVRIDDGLADFLAGLPYFAGVVSVDGLLSNHESIRGANTFALAWAGAERLARRRVPTQINFTFTNQNIGDWRELATMAHAIGANLNLNLFIPFKAGHQALIVSPEQYFHLILEARDLIEQGYAITFYDSSVNAFLGGQNGIEVDGCAAGTHSIVIGADGRMVACDTLGDAQYFDGQPVMFDQNFVQTWREHPAFVDFRARGTHGCQVRQRQFAGSIGVFDPYSIEAFYAYCQTHNIYLESESI